MYVCARIIASRAYEYHLLIEHASLAASMLVPCTGQPSLDARCRPDDIKLPAKSATLAANLSTNG